MTNSGMRHLGTASGILGVLVFLLARAVLRDPSGEGTLGSDAVGFIAAAPFITASIALIRAARKEEKSIDDTVAERTLTVVREGEAASFVLYLRPFWLDGVLQQHWKGRVRATLSLSLFLFGPLVALKRAFDNEEADLEAALVSGLRSRTSVVAFGRPGSHTGVGIVSIPDEKWWNEFLNMATGAKWILCVPAPAPSLRMELRWLIEGGLLSKVVFVMPPRTRHGDELRNSWNSSAATLREYGVEIPAYTEGGCLFRFGAEGLEQSPPLRRFVPRLLAQYFDRLTASGQPDTPPLTGRLLELGATVRSEAVDRH